MNKGLVGTILSSLSISATAMIEFLQTYVLLPLAIVISVATIIYWCFAISSKKKERDYYDAQLKHLKESDT